VIIFAEKFLKNIKLS